MSCFGQGPHPYGGWMFGLRQVLNLCGANGYAAIEATRGDMGWSTFSERCMKSSLVYKKRVERMEETRWVKKVCENVGQMSK